MISKTKTDLSTQKITALCAAAGYKDIENVHPLGAGEFNAVYAFDANGQAYALKVAPGADVPVMTYEQNMMQTEVFWYKQLQSQTDIAVPEIAYTDFSRSLLSSDYFIMQRIPGKQMNEMEFAPEEMQQVHQALPEMAAKMHRVTNKGYGYPQNGLHDTWTKALYSMAEAVIKDAQAVGKSCENGEKMLAYIKKHASVLDRASCCMVNFDLWDANIICQRTSNGILSVLIDPERGYWGDPVMDFLCREFDKPIKEKKNSLRAYNMSAVHPIMVGRDEEIRYAFAQAYLGIIMEVERYYRYIPGDEGWTRNDNVCQFLFGQAFASLETL